MIVSLPWQLFEISINLFQSILFSFFLRSRLHIKRDTPLVTAVPILLNTLFLSSYLYFDMPVPDSWSFLIFILYALYASDEPRYLCLFWGFILNIVVLVTIGITTQIFLAFVSPSYDILRMPGMPRVIYVLTVNLVLFLVLFLLSKIHHINNQLKLPYVVLFISINLCLLLTIEMLFRLQIQKLYEDTRSFFVAYAAVGLCSIFSIILFHLMTTIAQRQQQAQLELKQAQFAQHYQKTVEDMYQGMIIARHDLKHQMQTVEQLIENSGSEAAKNYFCQYEEKEEAQSHLYMTGCTAVDALLTAKSIACTNHGIELQLECCPLHELPVSEIDFCSILGNLLDNALEGTLRVSPLPQNCVIRLSLRRIWNMFYIRCENLMNPSSIHKKGDTYLSSKGDSSLFHGLGISSIISTAEKSEGFCEFNTQQNKFIAHVTIPYPLTATSK